MKEKVEIEKELEGLITKQVQKVINGKERLIKERLMVILGVTGLEINLEKEVQRMFPRIACKHSHIDNSEVYFWNDGTDFGREIITFYPLENKFNENLDENMESIKVTFGFKYR